MSRFSRTASWFASATILAVWMVHPDGAVAQSGAGSIQGTIQDATGAPIPSGAVHVVNESTRVAYDTASNHLGFYTVPGLFAGKYSVTFSAAGMKKYQTSVDLQNAQNLVLNPNLAVGDVAEQVTVSANTNQMATYDSGTVSTHLDNSRMDQLPMNGRNVLTLAGATVPGLESGGTRANGTMGEALEYTQDGAPMTNRNFGGESNSTQAQLPDPDAVQEVKIETLNSTAQFATPATAIITTKSGTNSIHGSAFETARNNGIGIAKARQNPANYAAPHLVRNEFGASVGGPIYIPKVYDGKNKSFFFFAYERFSLRQASNQFEYAPTAAMRNGDFSGLINSAGLLQTLYDPNTTQPASANYQRTPFPNNQIPISRESPLAKALYAATPLPNTADDPLVLPNLNDLNHNVQTVPNISFRLDHTFNENNRVYARFTNIDQFQQSLRNYPSNTPATIAGGGLPAGATGYQQIPITTISGALGYTHIFSATFFAETVVSQQWQRLYVQGAGNVNLDYEQMLGLPNNFGQSGFPNIGSNLLTPYGGSQYNYGMSQILSTLDENLTKVWGRHQLQFGGRYRHERFGYLPDRSADTVSFSNQATGVYDPATGANYGVKPNTGYQDADFFLGAASSYGQSKSAPFGHYRDQEMDFYFQDNIRVNSRLTLNAGLRWEGHPAPHTADGLAVSFDLAHDAMVLSNPLSFYIDKGYTTQAIITNLQNLGVKFETPQQAGIPSSGFYNSYLNFNPRLGFAYTPFSSRWGTVIRGGYGEYLYPVPIRNSLLTAVRELPWMASWTQSYTSAAQAPDGLPNYLLRSPQTVVAGVNSANVVNTTAANTLLPGISVSTLDPHYDPAHVKQANLTIEQPVKGGVFRITYLFVHGTDLDQYYQYNLNPSTYVWEATTGTVPPTGTYSGTATRPYDQLTWGTNQLLTKWGFSNNSAVQLNYERRFKNGYAYQVAYVYSRAFRIGGNSSRDSVLYPAAVYSPGTIPSTIITGTLIQPSEALNRWEDYHVDTAIPKQHLTFNGIVDLPVGRGKHWLRNSNRLLDAVVGGYQVAFTGQVLSQTFFVSSGNWGATNPIQVYKSGAPVNDCRSGVCHPAYLWFNGYLAPTVVNAAKNGVTGVPSGYVPYLSPINNTPGTSNFGNNNVTLTLKNGSQVQTAYSPGPVGANAYSQTALMGPYNYNADISLFKVFTLNERMKLRVNIDAFNAFNIQGRVNPNAADGVESLQTSYWTPRQVQFSGRLTF
ncbi:MAG TPA: carboxypeptidase regulatory-like domain-containing protein [Bryobacteraceae bacterium]|jgi:hypothetical protein